MQAFFLKDRTLNRSARSVRMVSENDLLKLEVICPFPLFNLEVQGAFV